MPCHPSTVYKRGRRIWNYKAAFERNENLSFSLLKWRLYIAKCEIFHCDRQVNIYTNSCNLCHPSVSLSSSFTASLSLLFLHIATTSLYLFHSFSVLILYNHRHHPSLSIIPPLPLNTHTHTRKHANTHMMPAFSSLAISTSEDVATTNGLKVLGKKQQPFKD